MLLGLFEIYLKEATSEEENNKNQFMCIFVCVSVIIIQIYYSLNL